MRAHRVAALVLRQLYLMRGSPARVVPLVVWVAIDIALRGFITRYFEAVTSPQYRFVSTLLGADPCGTSSGA